LSIDAEADSETEAAAEFSDFKPYLAKDELKLS
jgi:hypothetical protein